MPASRQDLLREEAPAAAPATDETSVVTAPSFIESAPGEADRTEAMERLDRAVADLRAIAIRPLLERAVVALRTDDYQGAAELALKALHRDERSAYGWYLLAMARERVNDFKGAKIGRASCRERV